MTCIWLYSLLATSNPVNLFSSCNTYFFTKNCTFVSDLCKKDSPLSWASLNYQYIQGDYVGAEEFLPQFTLQFA